MIPKLNDLHLNYRCSFTTKTTTNGSVTVVLIQIDSLKSITWTNWKCAIFAKRTFTDQDTGQGGFSSPCCSNDDNVRQGQIGWWRLIL